MCVFACVCEYVIKWIELVAFSILVFRIKDDFYEGLKKNQSLGLLRLLGFAGRRGSFVEKKL